MMRREPREITSVPIGVAVLIMVPYYMTPIVAVRTRPRHGEPFMRYEGIAGMQNFNVDEILAWWELPQFMDLVR